MRLYVTVLASSLLLCGCATVEFSPSGDRRVEPYTGTVQVLEILPAEGTYEMLGVVMVRGVNMTSDERMFEHLKERAAAQGADAVVPQGPIRISDGGDNRRLAGSAIRRK